MGRSEREAFRVGGTTRHRLDTHTIKLARRFRDRATDTERLLWFRLRELKALGYHFRRQVPFRGYFLDFAEHRTRVAIEIDGSQHGFADHIAHDTLRDRVLASEGYLVLRFSNGELFKEIDQVVEVIVRELEHRSPPTRQASPVDLPTRGR